MRLRNTRDQGRRCGEAEVGFSGAGLLEARCAEAKPEVRCELEDISARRAGDGGIKTGCAEAGCAGGHTSGE